MMNYHNLSTGDRRISEPSNSIIGKKGFGIPPKKMKISHLPQKEMRPYNIITSINPWGFIRSPGDLIDFGLRRPFFTLPLPRFS